MNNHIKALTALLMMLPALLSWGAYPLNYEASFTAGGGSGDFAPYYISSLRHGKLTQRIILSLKAKYGDRWMILNDLAMALALT